jgi:hypothetical protein
MLLKLILLLPATTANVERVFSAVSLVKNNLRNSMDDELLNHCLVTFIEQAAFINVSDDAIFETFIAMRQHRLKKEDFYRTRTPKLYHGVPRRSSHMLSGTSV